MKKALFVLVIFSSVMSLQAKIWTVDNTGKVANFTTTTAAVTGAQDGDTLLIGGSATAYSDINLTKKLIIYGTGYFLTENPNTIETKQPVTINNITFSYGSSGSEIIGLNNPIITIATDVENIVIRRCYVRRVNINGNNCLVKQCYITYGSGYSVSITGNNNIIRNCFIENGAGAVSSSANNIIENNVLNGPIGITSSSFGNNIIRGYTATFVNCDPYNNICNDIQCGTLNGNQAYVNITSVFLSTGTSDSKWQLSATSVAKAAGLGGIDCGMYGGNDPYILSGMPDIPVITAITVPSRASLTNGLNVQINIRSNK